MRRIRTTNRSGCRSSWFAILLLGVLPGDVNAVNAWPAFLGADAQQKAEASLALRWSPTENIAWQIEFPGHGQSSPIVWGARVFATSVEGPNKETLAQHPIRTACFKSHAMATDGRSVANGSPKQPLANFWDLRAVSKCPSSLANWLHR